MIIQKKYEKETGLKATYRKGSSDYHTLIYVEWLENKIKELYDRIKLKDETIEEFSQYHPLG